MSSESIAQRIEKWKKRRGEKAKSKIQDCCATFKHKHYLEILLSVHDWTSQANTLHLVQKVMKGMYGL